MKATAKWFCVGVLAASGLGGFACGGGTSEGGGPTSATASTPASATTSATPAASATPAQTAATPPPIVVIAMKLTGDKMLKGAVEVKADGTVLGPDGKMVAKFVGNELKDKDGSTLISVAADGTMTIAGSKHGTKFDDKDDLVVEGGAKFHVADDGAVMLYNEDGKADKDSGKLKIAGFQPRGRRAATVLVMGMLTPANASSAQISATANPSVPPPKK